MPKELPTKQDVDAAIRLLKSANQPQVTATVVQLAEAARANLDELNTVTAQVSAAQQQLAKAESTLSELQIRQAEADKQLQSRTAQLAKAENELGLAQARLADSATQIASLQATLSEVQDRLAKQTGASGTRTMVALVGELRAEAAPLLATPFRAAGTPGAPGVMIDGLEFEIRGDLAIGDKVGIRSFTADRAGPEGASVVRFSLKPEMRVQVPDVEKK